MDPLTALSLAASIAQFLDFGSKLISTTREIKDAGQSVSIKHLSNITTDLTNFNLTLKRQINLDATQVELTKEQKSLLDIAEKCQAVAVDFVNALENVTGKKGQTWENVRSALKTIWNKDRLETIARQLSDYRGQLTLRVLLLLNSHQRQQDYDLSLLHEDSKEIVEVISINCENLQSSIKGLFDGEKARRQNDYAEFERRHAETIAAILTTRDGNSTAITAPNYLPDNSTQLSGAKVVRTTTIYKQAVEHVHPTPDEPASFETTEFTSFTKIILDALHFRAISSRRSAIPKAHKNTFQWIYRDPEACDKPWENFSRWLRSGQGIYFVNGKAGSGKSTLMKFLQGDPRTGEALSQWANGSELIVASFFFWYAGTSLQKSQAGLLRSLLHDVLTKRPELVPILFPDISRSILAKQLPDCIELSDIELHKAFTTFINSVPAGLKVFFMIDGIDEYAGDHSDISELISQAANSDFVKILVSSRPIPACIHAFSSCPTLRLQDLTRKDVQHYVQEKLGRNCLMQKLEMADQGATRQLIENITSKASGVLLWVVLVVRTLLNGLIDYDTTEDLLQKLDELPPDLEQLYDHMLGSMSSQNRRQGSKMLQLVLRSTETHENYPMTLLQLSFAEDEDYKKPFESNISPLSIQEEDWRRESTEGRMRSRCCGLIEVQNDPISSGNCVGFLHRTVVEFLQTDTIWPQLVRLTEKTKFDVNKALLSSSLAEMKAKPPAPEQNQCESPAYYSMLRMLSYERNMELIGDLFHKLYLPEVKNTMSHYWYSPELFPTPKIEVQVISEAAIRASNRLNLIYPLSFLFFAGSHCPKNHFQGLLNWHISKISQPHPYADRHMLDACLFIQYMDEVQVPLRIALSRNIMKTGTYPNRPIYLATKKLWNFRWKEAISRTSDWSLWEACLHHTHSTMKMDSKETLAFIQTGLADSHLNIIIAALYRGADINTNITILSKPYGSGKNESHELSADKVIHSFMLRIWKRYTSKDPSSNRKDRDAATNILNNLAEKCCSIEKLMSSNDTNMISETASNKLKASSTSFLWKYKKKPADKHKEQPTENPKGPGQVHTCLSCKMNNIKEMAAAAQSAQNARNTFVKRRDVG